MQDCTKQNLSMWSRAEQFLQFSSCNFQGGWLRSTYFIYFHTFKCLLEYMVENVDGIQLSEVVFTASWYASRCAVSSLAAIPEKPGSPRGLEWYLPLPHGYLYLAISRELKPHSFHKKYPTANGGSCDYMHAEGWSRPSYFTWGKFQLNEWEFHLMSGPDLQYMENMNPLLPLQPSAFGCCLETASANCCMFADPRLLMEDVILQHLSMSETNSIHFYSITKIFFSIIIH